MEHLGTWMSALTVPAVQGGCTVRDKCAPLSPAPTPQRLLDSAVLNVRQTDCVHVLLLQSYCIHCLVIHHHCQTAYMFCLPSQNSDLPRAPLSTYRCARSGLNAVRNGGVRHAQLASFPGPPPPLRTWERG